MIANLVANAKVVKAEFSEDLLRHMVLNSIRIYRNQFRSVAPLDRDVIIACEGGRSWRSTVFPHYKANRKKDGDPLFDWQSIFTVFDMLREEFMEHLPYSTIRVQGAEADDIIGYFARHSGTGCVIVSRDKDFKQLHRTNVRQWDPISKEWIDGAGDVYLREHIIRGDSGDGIPNVLSDDDTFVNPTKKQTMLSKKRFDRLWKSGPETEWELRNWKRNEELVDLSKTPHDIQQGIFDAYNARVVDHTTRDVHAYFVKKGLRNLMEHINEF
jgi:hypothetical protein